MISSQPQQQRQKSKVHILSFDLGLLFLQRYQRNLDRLLSPCRIAIPQKLQLVAYCQGPLVEQVRYIVHHWHLQLHCIHTGLQIVYIELLLASLLGVLLKRRIQLLPSPY